jgi:hypothetical protein
VPHHGGHRVAADPVRAIPRHADLPDELSGRHIFEYQTRPENEWVTAPERDRIGTEVARRIVRFV